MAIPNIKDGKRFSEDVYASKEEVKAIYNTSDIDSVWDNILSYRYFYDAETDIQDTSNSHYKICLTRKLLGQAYSLQLKLSKDLIDLISLPSLLQGQFLLERQVTSLTHTAKANSISISSNTIRRMANNEIESIPGDLFILKAFNTAFKKASQLEKIELEDIETLNKLLSGMSEEDRVKYRNETNIDIINPLLEPNSEDIPSHLEHLLTFLKDNDIPLLLRALTIIYVFDYLRPFEYCNEATGALLSKAFLKVNGLGLVGFTLDFESIAYSQGQSFFARLKNVESSLDLTYFLQPTLAFLSMDENNAASLLKEYSIQALQNKQTSANPTGEETLAPNEFKVEADPVSYALPSFPMSSNMNEIEATARKLKEVYPQLKKKQAHFYAGHCTVGLYYTIEQFKKEENTVYETARTSMEDLANRGFYRKEQIGKKFVYTPVPNEHNS